MTTLKTAPRQREDASHKVGYAVAAAINGLLLYLINVRPGWQTVPFLTEDMRLVLGLINASLAVNVAANLLLLVRDPAWFKALTDVVTVAVGFAALVRIWQVFPIDFAGSRFWELVARILLVLGAVGSAISVVTTLGSMLRGRPRLGS